MCRWLLHHAPDVLRPFALSVWDVMTGVKLGGEGQPLELAEVAALRLFNCDVRELVHDARALDISWIGNSSGNFTQRNLRCVWR